MSDYNSLAIYDIRSYLWDAIKQNQILNENDYLADGFDEPLIPIIPSQQVPEFNNLMPSKTYIVYEYRTLPIRENWWIFEETANFFIVSPKYEEIQKIQNFMVDIFRRYDTSAHDIRYSPIISNNFIFYYTAIDQVSAPQGLKDEGGLRMGEVSLMYSYSRITDYYGRF